MFRDGVILICPECRSDSCRRSKRRGLKDYLIGIARLRPWRCRVCQLRFYGWAVPISYAGYAHCRLCGNLDLERISREHVFEGWFAWFSRLLHVPAYRCDPCRHRFFSMRPRRRVLPGHRESATN